MMLGIRYVGASVCVCVWVQSENPYVCFGAKPTQRTCMRDLPRDRKEEERKVPEISRHERAVKRRTQSAEGSSRDQPAEGGSQKMKAGQRREKNRSQKDDC